MRPKPYIGVTGFMCREEVDAVLAALPQNFTHLIMMGVLVSGKTLFGMPNKWPNRYPKIETLHTIFHPRQNLLNLIHFNTKNQDKLVNEMLTAQELAGPHCHGFQLNIAWPDPKALEQYKRKAPSWHRTIVLQCGARAVIEAGSLEEVELRLKRYEELVEYVLIDPSGGLGMDFDEAQMFTTLYYMRRNISDSIGLGIGGGLHSDNLDRLRPMLRHFEFSIDAEGKLRDEMDQLDISEAVLYLKRSAALFAENKKAA